MVTKTGLMNRFFPAYLIAVLLTAPLFACSPEPEESAPEPSSEPAVEQRESPPPAVSDSVRAPQSPAASTTTPQRRVRRQTVYVPAYSHIYFRDRERTINLTTTLSIHNIDADHPIRLTRVDYYNSDGELVQRPLEQPETLRTFASTWYVIEESNLSGGVGANFIVGWEAEAPVHPPVIESVMISTRHSQGISFTSQGRVLQEE